MGKAEISGEEDGTTQDPSFRWGDGWRDLSSSPSRKLQDATDGTDAGSGEAEVTRAESKPPHRRPLA